MSLALELSQKQLRDAVRIFKTLSDYSRVRILWLLISEGEMNVSDIADQLNLTTSNVSHHLSSLEMLGFIARRKEGKRVYYKLDDDCIIDILRRTKEHVDGR